MSNTRFEELSYKRFDAGDWRIVEADGGNIGPIYKSRLELLGDLTRFAREYGCEATDAMGQEHHGPGVGELATLLELAVKRVMLENEGGNPILSGWLPDAQAALARLRVDLTV